GGDAVDLNSPPCHPGPPDERLVRNLRASGWLCSEICFQRGEGGQRLGPGRTCEEVDPFERDETLFGPGEPGSQERLRRQGTASPGELSRPPSSGSVYGLVVLVPPPAE